MHIVKVRTGKITLKTVAQFPTLIDAKMYIAIQQTMYPNQSLFYITRTRYEIIGYTIAVLVGIPIGILILFTLIMIVA